MEPALFQVSISGLTGSTDELGVWQPAPASDSALEISFAARPGEIQANHWQIRLPEDPAAAREALAGPASRLERSTRALPSASRRLKQFTRQRQEAGFAGRAFAAAGRAGQSSGPAEQNLDEWVSRAGAEASFGAPGGLPLDLKEITQGAAGFFERVRRSLLYFTWVESFSGLRRLGLTAVGWTGDLNTVWRNDLAPEEADLHFNSLELAMRTRASWLRMLGLVARGGLQLSVLFPTAPLLAVPAAWRFIKDIMEELNGIRT